MQIHLTDNARDDLSGAPLAVQKAFIKQIRMLVHNIRHRSIDAKKYVHEGEDLWQGRVTKSWRFYFIIEGDSYRIVEIRKHTG